MSAARRAIICTGTTDVPHRRHVLYAFDGPHWRTTGRRHHGRGTTPSRGAELVCRFGDYAQRLSEEAVERLRALMVEHGTTEWDVHHHP